jgi:ankyrin repeat protein
LNLRQQYSFLYMHSFSLALHLLHRLDIMRLLLTYNAAVDAVNSDSATPLHFAAQRGHIDACTLLLDHGAKVRIYSQLYSAYRQHASHV